MEKTSSSSSKKREEISEMPDGWLLTLPRGGLERDDVREPISVLPGNGCPRPL